jgi:hypothetical protein
MVLRQAADQCGAGDDTDSSTKLVPEPSRDRPGTDVSSEWQLDIDIVIYAENITTTGEWEVILPILWRLCTPNSSFIRSWNAICFPTTKELKNAWTTCSQVDNSGIELYIPLE